MNFLVWLIYVVSCTVALASWFVLMRDVKSILLKDILLVVPVALCFTPTVVGVGSFAPAIAGFALDVVAHGGAGLIPHGPILLLGILVSLGTLLLLKKYLRPKLQNTKKLDSRWLSVLLLKV
jgi:hypothetical protein